MLASASGCRLLITAVTAGILSSFCLQAAAQADIIRLKNGNVMRGKIVSERGSTVEIDIPEVGTLRFEAEEVASVEEEGQSAGSFTHAVKLANRNVLYGRLESEGEQVTIDIPGTGVLSFPKDEVASIEELTPEQAQRLEENLGRIEAASGGAAYEPDPSAPAEYDEMETLEHEIEQRRESALQQVAQARELAQKYQGLQTGIASPQLMLGKSGPAANLQKLDPATAAMLEPILKLVSAFAMWIFVGSFLAAIFYAVCLQRIADRTSTDDDWMAWVPILHQFLAVRVAGRSFWWFLLYFVPLIQIIVDPVVWGGIAKARGYSPWLGLLAWVPVVNLILVGYLAFGKDGVPNEPKTEEIKLTEIKLS